MNKEISLKYHEIVMSLEEEAAIYIRINQSFIKDIIKYVQTEDGAKIFQAIIDRSKNHIESDGILDVNSFKHGLIIGANLDEANARIEDVKEIDNFSNKEENSIFLKKADDYNRETIETINRIDTLVDMFFSNLYTMKGKKKTHYFWRDYKKDFNEMGINIEPIMEDMVILKDLRKIRNVYQHNNGNVDDQFCKHFNVNVKDLDIAKVQVSAYNVQLYFVSLLDLFEKLLNNVDGFDIMATLQNCSNLKRIKEEYDMVGKKQQK